MTAPRRTTSVQSAAAYRTARRTRGRNSPRIHLDLSRGIVEELRRACEDRIAQGNASNATRVAMFALDEALG